MSARPCVLTIAGSDSGGGAGIQADLKTFMAHRCYGASVVTALTAQNTRGVTGIHAPEPGFVALQLRTVLEDIPVAAAKTGMLFSAAIVEAVAAGLERKRFPLVVDPVCISQSGHALLKGDALDALRRRMLPLADLATPNRPEAEALTGMAVTDRESLLAVLEKLLSFGPRAVLLKGGHMEARDGELIDWLALPGQEPEPLPVPQVDTPHTHGTGCALSAAIAARLARGEALRDAVRGAQTFLNRALVAGFAVGRGASPPDHLADFGESC
ncbi:Hydroxymethylpyrimidine/phosphomethylpyrimidine kinase [Fundidesulfovibrio magnetotacticus]|uniref:hydroxymethylpyrimidine kinase n=1 Tax=Fundidesulfovibrio magnetotacticus TaxID=2730080 RepID=A0A6V8M068_9BACT|nr:bifunctional hydroxymethylpyrimidine kinase/phosphomethylpyrimidine kinase [Fundidesulfovibrio magnetotacticus]GFK95858.1 Hydroxymethylpyrimidine/phosphomethylpyrimidine kinase [Fundidesulfovibrio magnetotacticus]